MVWTDTAGRGLGLRQEDEDSDYNLPNLQVPSLLCGYLRIV